MTLIEILLEQNYLHSLIQNGIDVEENTNKMTKNYNNPLLVDSRVNFDVSVLETFTHRSQDGYSFKLGKDILEVSLHEDNTNPSNIGRISKAVGNIVGEIYITDTNLYLVYRRNNFSDMDRSLTSSYVKASISHGPAIF